MLFNAFFESSSDSFTVPATLVWLFLGRKPSRPFDLYIPLAMTACYYTSFSSSLSIIFSEEPI